MSVNKSQLNASFKKKKPDFPFKRVDIKNAQKYLNKDFSKDRRASFKNFDKWITELNGEYLINGENDDIIGRIFIYKKSKEITSFKINPNYRGYGFSEIMLKDAIRKYNGTWLGVHTDNEIAIRLYKKMGFEENDEERLTVKDGEIMFMELKKGGQTMLETEIIKKYQEGKLNEDKCLDLLEAVYTENYIIPERNYEINLMKWGPGHPLWITGTSGDGKSTLARKYYNETYNAALVTLDCLLMRLTYLKEKYTRKVLNNPPLLKENFIIMRFINDHNDKMPWEVSAGSDEACYWFNEFFNWLLSEAKTTYSKYRIIVEGCSVAEFGNPRMFVKEPLIIMGTTRLQGSLRRMKRDISGGNKGFGDSNGESLFTAIKHEQRRKNTIKRLLHDKESFKKMMKIINK